MRFAKHKLAVRNVNKLRTIRSVLEWMRARSKSPKYREEARLGEEGSKVGIFWVNCKIGRKCMKSPYERLLSNPVLAEDYRTTRCFGMRMRSSNTIRLYQLRSRLRLYGSRHPY